ncbi:pyrroline-5-carboxylate reductase [Fuchsiella alkaliacetigena]|uniref:pyrroline-5-carboxylate reductase n=1 Tax=Fuchsiella alkaliacetigena TaxID=957042 RepID=UPI00200A44BA|nr:pyrroline-5-carboxylate reductase [Fuchsiella alkaliacetigena]MCK8823701.1 pyrroline-5-carboxylate reductase [Fuchsiella alkaliacetigena]
MKSSKIGFIGTGAIAEALISGLLESNRFKAEQIIGSDISSSRREELKTKYGIEVTADNRLVVQQSDYLILAVKPQVLTEVLAEISELITVEQLILSIAAGVNIDRIESAISETRVPIVRVMPNTPALVKEGAIAYSLGSYADQNLAEQIEKLLGAVGKVIQVKESLMDAVTGLSGSGPAFVLLILEALAAGGVRNGLTHQQAEELAIQTLLGTAKLASESEEHLAALRDQVTSPAGTTAEGLYSLEQGGVRAAIIEAVSAACERSKEL